MSRDEQSFLGAGALVVMTASLAVVIAVLWSVAIFAAGFHAGQQVPDIRALIDTVERVRERAVRLQTLADTFQVELRQQRATACTPRVVVRPVRDSVVTHKYPKVRGAMPPLSDAKSQFR